MRKIYTLVLFLFSISYLYSQSAICDNPTPICGNINPTPNTTNVPSLGGIGCLSNTPNPNWFIFKVGYTGNLEYNLHQGNNAPFYNNLDVDFVCWGPFTSTSNCNTQLYGYPAGNTSIPNNIVACSYSPSQQEQFTIPSADTNKYYVILTTNFSNLPGNFVLEQTNASSSGSGSTDCSTICGIFLSNEFNQELPTSFTNCSEVTTSYNLKCNLRTPNPNTLTYQWYLNDVLQPALTTQQVAVSQTGTWKVVTTNPNCNSLEEDSITITFGIIPAINTTTYTVNGPLNTCNPIVNLKNEDTFILNGLNPNDNTVEYFLDENDSWVGNNPILNPETFTTNQNTIIYVQVTNLLSNCTEYTFFTIDIDCSNTELVITTQPQNQSTNSNATVVFTTNITNAATYIWQMSTDGINWTSITNGGINPTFNGANTNTLTINNVPANYDENLFRVLATSATDTKISNPATLSIVLSNNSYELSEFSISPNPSKNNFILYLKENNLFEDLKYSIYDLKGRKLLENKINSLETILPIENYQTGIYLIEINTSSGKLTKKLIKQ